MTVEEAVELILRGNPWLPCLKCEYGMVRIEGGKGSDQCPDCEGYASVLDPDYAEACRITGKPIPTEREAYSVPLSKILSENSMKDFSGVSGQFEIIIDD